MTFDLWLAFVAASAVMLAIPGPTIMLVITYAIGEGRRSAWSTVAGVTLGDFTAMTASLLGLGALLTASAELFAVLKLLGAAYLVYLGIRLFRARPERSETEPSTPAKPRRGSTMLWHAFAVTALNPKSIVFFVAFLPQFMRPTEPLLPQIILLEVTFLALAALNAAFFALLAGRARGVVRRQSVRRTINRVGGGLLAGAGFATAAVQEVKKNL
jgi:threonine/homoserine/homoserine lactone efflux protein